MRAKIEVDQLYYMRMFGVGKNSKPLKTYVDYLVRVFEVERPIREDRGGVFHVEVLATMDVREGLGIPYSEYNWRDQSFDPVPHKHTLFLGRHKGSDCSTWRKFDRVRDLPVVLTWDYVSDDVVVMLGA